MTSPQVAGLAKLIRNELPGHGHDLDGAVGAVKATIVEISGVVDEAAIAEALEIVRVELQVIEILHPGNSMFGQKPNWYGGPRPGDRHWPAHHSYLSNVKKWEPTTIESIDRTSTEVVALLANPAEENFSCRGLVVGHVQSGKTASMTAVIAKAIDAGYNLVIILAGLTDKLRQQTQRRMEKDLVACNPILWRRLTSADIKGDFRRPSHGSLEHFVDKAQIAVVKKNVGPLRQLLDAIQKMQPVERRKLRVLLIDDEADQASPNAASKELDMTAINEKLREIVAAFPAISYIGYTATPFANVFIDPYAQNGDGLDDLYPRDFITALPRPTGYFGTEQLFGRPPIDPENEADDEAGIDMIRNVPDEEEKFLQPPSRKEKDKFNPKPVPSLERAVLYFLACCAARRARGQAGQHMTMLVHTSAYVVLHQRLAAMIEAWLSVNGPDLQSGTGPVSGELREIWDEEAGRLPEDITTARPINTEEVFEQLPAVLNALKVVIENGASDDRIDYEEKPQTYIVVGGSVLARGLTLEGLTVSYFLRTANQYDTLLQMGRWFGYRRGYEDLPRIWMPSGLRLNFRALAGIEAEIREEISDYAEHGETPMDFAVKVRAIPGMAITAAAKMRKARRCDVNYWGRHVQTIRFDHRDDEIVASNWLAAGHLIESALELGLKSMHADGILFEGVPKATILQFLRDYRINANHRDLSNSILVDFVEGSTELLQKWNVGIIQPSRGPNSKKGLGPLVDIKLSRRSRLDDGDPSKPADIKALMSRRDVLFDCPKDMAKPQDTDWETLKSARKGAGIEVPLLLLYPIDAKSPAAVPAEGKKSVRVDLDAVDDLVGIGIVFPGSREKAGEFFSVEIQGPSKEEVDEAEAQELESEMAAGVE